MPKRIPIHWWDNLWKSIFGNISNMDRLNFWHVSPSDYIITYSLALQMPQPVTIPAQMAPNRFQPPFRPPDSTPDYPRIAQEMGLNYHELSSASGNYFVVNSIWTVYTKNEFHILSMGNYPIIFIHQVQALIRIPSMTW